MNKITEQLFTITKAIVDPTRSDLLTVNSMLFEEHLLDSLGLMQLLTEIDNEFSISIKTEDLTTQNFASVNHISELIERYIAEGN